MLTISGVGYGGTRGQIARSEFLVSRKRLIKVKMLKDEFPDEIDPMAAFQKPMGLDPNLRLQKDMTPKEKWKVAR